MLDSIIDTYLPEDVDPEDWDLDALKREASRVFAIDTASLDFGGHSAGEIRDMLWTQALAAYDEKEKLLSREILQRVERDIMLQVVDQQWKDHLYSLDHLKEGIGLRGYGQRDPLVEYKKESFSMFQAMKDRIDEEIIRYLWWLRPVPAEEAAPVRRMQPRRSPLLLNNPSSDTASAFANAPRPVQTAAPRAQQQTGPRVGSDDAPVKTVRREEPKVGRNEPCPCGSGKKYKKCHGAAA